MNTFGMIFAGIGASAMIRALTLVTLVVGGLVNAMILLMPWPGHRQGAGQESEAQGAGSGLVEARAPACWPS